MSERIVEIYRRHGSRRMNPAFWAVCNYHYGIWANTVGFAPLRWLLSKVYGLNLFLLMTITGIELHRESRIGRELHLIHGWNIRISPDAVIGDRCGIQQDVVVGTSVDRTGVPTIGNDVYIGSGAKVLGDVTVGDGARVGANSLVVRDVPAGATAVGVPARIMRYTGRHAEVPE